jgi:anti-anti-sigma regulatory factor
VTTTTDADVRLYAPSSEAVIVRPSGRLGGATGRLLGLRIYQQLRRAPHVVVDLVDVESVDADGTRELIAADAYARAWHVRLHITGVGRDVAAGLRSAGLNRPIDAGGASDVLARLRPAARRRPRSRTDRHAPQGV